ncbi:hypothetical protein GGX14DRAFT_403746 [Mycena pura]|uniref:Uncharacterized protein n=1 Tax=Mycena pura TaxID=153505 RepID=A0AAD6Y484_9AGAR|nr:hypothetical protein GGX14DRAFT_403746 [Mycena pura]
MLSAKEITDISDDDDFKTLAHLPAGAILVHIAENVNVDDRAGEISNKTFGMFKELQIQKAGLLSAYSGEAEGKFGCRSDPNPDKKSWLLRTKNPDKKLARANFSIIPPKA